MYPIKSSEHYWLVCFPMRRLCYVHRIDKTPCLIYLVIYDPLLQAIPSHSLGTLNFATGQPLLPLTLAHRDVARDSRAPHAERRRSGLQVACTPARRPSCPSTCRRQTGHATTGQHIKSAGSLWNCVLWPATVRSARWSDSHHPHIPHPTPLPLQHSSIL